MPLLLVLRDSESERAREIVRTPSTARSACASNYGIWICREGHDMTQFKPPLPSSSLVVLACGPSPPRQVASLLRENAGAKTEAGLRAGDLQQRLNGAQDDLAREREAFAERKVRGRREKVSMIGARRNGYL